MSNEIQFLLYSLPDEEGKVQVVIKDETIWCTQKAMAQLFGVDKSGISRHISNIFKEGELQQDTTVAKIATVVNRGIRGEVEEQVDFYNLDMIIAVGYRVSSPKATRFRQWSTKILNEYIKKGFVMDDERLKQGKAIFGKDYFRELLERVRSIRTSERRIWQQITDIYAECSIDYDKNAPTTREFYAMIQNRFHYAITGQTAAEIIYTKADHSKDHMGLTTWKNAPDGRVLKSDVTVAKNYLQEKEIRQLERAVSSYFDYIENQIERQNAFNMEQFAASVDKFLTFNDYKILPGKGRISAAQAKEKAESEYDIFNKTQHIDSDFDKQIRGMLGDKK
ncbi:MAG: virulence RhuM family protein [Prevotellaceae bacterium]|nr:virulence RhuM family protein [Prevotellaceae bacterium]